MSLLNKIQRELKAPKSQFSSFGKYHYRNCEDILEAVKPLLGDNGAVIVRDEMVQLGARFYVKATAELVEDGKVIATGCAFAREAEYKKGMDEAQITGAASSYARKYALNGLFAIDDTKDADTEDGPRETKPQKPAAVSRAEGKGAELKSEIKKLCDGDANEVLSSKGDYERYVLTKTGLKLEPANFETIIERLKAL